MKKAGILIVLAVFLIASVSADIIFTEQPQKVYNLGEGIVIPFTVKTLSDLSRTIEMNLICSGQELNFYKNGVILNAGEEKRLEGALVLTKTNIGTLKGACRIKAKLGEEYALTNDFTMSDYVTIAYEIKTPEIAPKENIMIEGNAAKQSGKGLNGFIEINVFKEGGTNGTPYLSNMGTTNNGFFTFNISTPEDMEAGAYTVTIKAYEKDSKGEITNQGSSENSFAVKQVPRTLEIVIENPEVEPGTPLKAKTILHDQTGFNIKTNTIVLIKDVNDDLIEKKELSTDEFFEFPIEAQHPPEELKISASAGGLESNSSFRIGEKFDVDIQIINKTLVITNTGNVPYCNKSILIKIGGSPLNIRPCLEVGKEQKYLLSAPDGEWEIEIITEGEDALKQKATLTGGAVGIQEAAQGISSISRYPLIWIFVIGIMGFIAFMIFKKGYKRSFIGGFIHRKSPIKELKVAEPKLMPLGKRSLIKSRNKAELSLSIKGEKQNVSVAAVKVKNLAEIGSQKGSGEETLQKIVDMAEDHKALTYENDQYIFFILAPAKTKTFQNEKTAATIASKIKEILVHHNKTFRQKIEFGISLNYGTIVGKQEETFKFMSMGTLIMSSKKLASHSQGEIFIGEKFKEKLPANVRTERLTIDNIHYYRITEVRGVSDEHQKFIRNFMQRNK